MQYVKFYPTRQPLSQMAMIIICYIIRDYPHLILNQRFTYKTSHHETTHYKMAHHTTTTYTSTPKKVKQIYVKSNSKILYVM
jgi:hypothetical protein